ncbi:MAG: GNAT family N-acetyltransferase, partial [Bacteroidota bacterium]
MNRLLDDITIRTTYRPGDLGYIAYMHGIHYDFGPEFEQYVAELLVGFYRFMDPDREQMWLAEYRGDIVGSIALKHTDGQAQLRYFLIDPNFRGIGLGKRLMDLFMDFLHQKRYRSSFLLTEDHLHT